MSLTHYATEIEYKHKSFTLGQQMLIASFTLPAEPFNSIPSINSVLPALAHDSIQVILKNEHIIYIINNSYGGLFYETITLMESETINVTTQYQWYVFVDPTIYTFCQLKYADEIAGMANKSLDNY